MIDDSELIENVSDKTENEVQNGPTATDDTRCPCSSGCYDSQVSVLMSNKEVGTIVVRNPVVMMHKAMQAAILKLQPQVREMEIIWDTLVNIWFNMFQTPAHKTKRLLWGSQEPEFWPVINVLLF